jgi:thioredoxin-dependent peroxiredoxin
MRFASSVVLSTLALGVTASTAHAQGAVPSPDPQPLAVGTVAPDFTLPGGTRYGVLRAPIHLADFRGKTVVLAFFYKARTRG